MRVELGMKGKQSLLCQVINTHVMEEDGEASKVQILTLKNVKVYTIGKELSAYGLTNLKIADCRNAGLSEMFGFESCLQLQELYLCENNVRRIRNIQHLNKLKFVDLRGNHILELTSIQGINNMPTSIRQIRLGHNHLTQVRELMVKLQATMLDNLWVHDNSFIKEKEIGWIKTILGMKKIDKTDFFYESE